MQVDQKTRVPGYPVPVVKSTVIKFELITACDGQTDGQTHHTRLRRELA